MLVKGVTGDIFLNGRCDFIKSCDILNANINKLTQNNTRMYFYTDW